jgi:hypothetical protein
MLITLLILSRGDHDLGFYAVETSSFGSESVAMKHGTEYVRGRRYKLLMMGIPVKGPTYIYGDNQSVLFNTTIPESTLKRKSQEYLLSICPRRKCTG